MKTHICIQDLDKTASDVPHIKEKTLWTLKQEVNSLNRIWYEFEELVGYVYDSYFF